MKTNIINTAITIISLLLILDSCKVPTLAARKESRDVPAAYNQMQDTINSASLQWKTFFNDTNLVNLIDTALRNNQELNITLYEIQISKNEIGIRKGEYLPFAGIRGGAGFEKEGRYTRHGAVDESIDIKPGKRIPELLPDYKIGLYASWEIDAWKKLRNARKAATLRYLASVQGRNFMVTNLVAEIASSYYELMALDNRLLIVQQNISLQDSALQITKKEKDAARVSLLAVNRFEAQLLHTQNLQYEIRQQIVETENRINFLTGRFPTPVIRSTEKLTDIVDNPVHAGIPSQLLVNRPDIQQAELEMEAARLDTKSARASFFPSFTLNAGIGWQAFNPAYLIKPASILYNLAGDLVAPIVNKNAIRAVYQNANAKQIQAVYNYERTILNAEAEVVNLLAKMENFENSYQTKRKEVEILKASISVSNSLFRSARADYIEVLTTQREVLESRMDLVEIKLNEMTSFVNLYRAIGGGWR